MAIGVHVNKSRKPALAPKRASKRMTGHSLWHPPKGWMNREPFPGLATLRDPTVTLEEIRKAVEEGPAWPCPPVTWRDLLARFD